MFLRQRIWLGAILAALAAPLASALPAAEPLPTAFLLGEPPLAAQLAGIDLDWNISFRAGGKLRVVPTADLAYWGRYRDTETGPQILLSDGSVIRADPLQLGEESLTLGDATGLGRGLWDESEIPRSALLAILYQPPALATSRDRLLDDLAQADDADDRLLLVGGESVAGTLLSAPLDGRFLPADAQAGQGEFRLARRNLAEPLAIPAGKVVALSLAAAAPQPLGKDRPVWLGCRDGSLLHAARVEVHGGSVTLELAAGGALTTTLAGRDDPEKKFWDEIALVQPAAASVRWLSDLKTLGYKHIPLLDLEWSYHADRNCLGGRLRTERALFLKGLGMHSTSRLAYDVAGYRRFEAELALDQSAGNRGSAIYKVLLQDGAGAWRAGYESPVVRGGDAPLAVSLDLAGAARIALIVEFADRGDELDRANWLSARLMK